MLHGNVYLQYTILCSFQRKIFIILRLLSLLLGQRRFCNELSYRIDKALQTVTWLRRLVAGFSPQKPGFDSRPVHMVFIVKKVSLGQTFIQILLLSRVSIIPPLLPIHAFIPLPSTTYSLNYDSVVTLRSEVYF